MQESFSTESQALDAVLQAGWIKSAEWLPEVDSTNHLALRALASATDSGAAVELPALWIADRQTAGRGRSDHRWWSPEGCLMLTLALDGSQWARTQNEISQLALVAGVAKAKALESFVAPATPVQLKWPNDTFLAGRKCGGILIESGPRGIWRVGMGLNVHVELSAAPSDVRDRAASVHQYAPPGTPTSTATMLVALTDQLQYWVDSWASGSTLWREQWNEYCLLSGKVVRALAPDGTQTIGRCEGIDLDGQLWIRDEMGVTRFGSGEILDWQ